MRTRCAERYRTDELIPIYRAENGMANRSSRSACIHLSANDVVFVFMVSIVRTRFL